MKSYTCVIVDVNLLSFLRKLDEFSSKLSPLKNDGEIIHTQILMSDRNPPNANELNQPLLQTVRGVCDVHVISWSCFVRGGRNFREIVNHSYTHTCVMNRPHTK